MLQTFFSLGNHKIALFSKAKWASDHSLPAVIFKRALRAWLLLTFSATGVMNWQRLFRKFQPEWGSPWVSSLFRSLPSSALPGCDVQNRKQY